MRRLVRSCGLLLNFQPQKADLETFRRSRTVLDVPGRSRTFPDGPLVSACVRFCPDLWVDKKDNQGYFSNGWPIYFSRTPVISICRSDITWRIRHLSIRASQTVPDGPRRSQTVPDGPRRSRTVPDGPGRSRTVPDVPRTVQTSQICASAFRG